MKIKKLTTKQLIIATDRLTRFKDPEIKYLRVFKEIILNNIIEPKYKKNDLDKLDYEEIKNLAEYTINCSLDKKPQDNKINNKLLEYESSIFNINEETKKLLKNNINYEELIKLLPDNIPLNLKFLKSLAFDNAERKYCFPVQKVILCEGITEEILLPKFAKLCGFDFNKNGIYIISAGGKNQVVKYFYNFANSLKIPIFVLFDNDAKENLQEIQPKLRKFDKIHLLESGEFEDLLTNHLIIKTLKYATQNISIPTIEGLDNCNSKVEFLEEFFKHRGLHEFKKAEFAQLVKENITSTEDISEEIIEIINKLQ